MNTSTNPYAGHRYPAEIISHAVRLYFQFTVTVVPSLPTWLLQALGDDTVVHAKHLFGQMRQE
jgi:transposase-like protein